MDSQERIFDRLIFVLAFRVDEITTGVMSSEGKPGQKEI